VVLKHRYNFAFYLLLMNRMCPGSNTLFLTLNEEYKYSALEYKALTGINIDPTERT